jgi:hypothetical protein
MIGPAREYQRSFVGSNFSAVGLAYGMALWLYQRSTTNKEGRRAD